MNPPLGVIFALVGAAAGAILANGNGVFFCGICGALIGFVLGELVLVKGRLLALEQQIAQLVAAIKTRPQQPPTTTVTAVAPPPPDKSPAAVLSEFRDTVEAPQSQAPRMHAPMAPPAADLPISGALRRFFTGGNTLVRVGVIVLFFGVAFLLRYAAEHTRVPIELRLAGVGLGAMALLVLGWVMRKSRPGYALALQGGGVGILYLTIFAALHLYGVLQPPLAFALLATVALLSAALAVMQDSQSFALLAVTGGFLAPVLSSTDQDSHVLLFSYYAVLNAAIVLMAWFKAWRPLNLAGFLFTFVIATLWGVLRYRAEYFATTEPFLIAFFLFYVSISVLFALRQAPDLKGYVDGTLVFGLPIVAFGLQATMLHGRMLSLAYSATAVSALYLGLAAILKRVDRTAQRALFEAFVALGVMFLTLAVPLALDARWNAATWALEACAVIWVGCRQNRRVQRAFGVFLMIAAGVVVANAFGVAGGQLTLAGEAVLSVLVLSAASVFSARVLHAYKKSLHESERHLASLLFLWALLWWLLGAAAETSRWVPQWYATAAMLILFSVTALLAGEFYRRCRLEISRTIALLLLPVMAVFAVVAATAGRHPFTQGGWLSWPCAFAVFYLLARRHEGAADTSWTKALHIAGFWLLCTLLSWEFAWSVNDWVTGSNSWPLAAAAVVPTLALFLLPRLVTRVAWPFAAHREAYLLFAGIGLAVYLGVWSLLNNLGQQGDAAPLPYLPLLNPLDVVQALVLLVLLRYWRFLNVASSSAFAGLDARLFPALFAGLGFIWANAMLLRTLHFRAGVPFSLSAFMQSTLVQTSLSIFWTVLALSTMLLAARKLNRSAWVAGAALMTVVIAKLFLVDLSRIGSVERIVSFVGVGLLMLIVGFWSPIPPATPERDLSRG
jgi:uncharacterized membrane protein